MLACIKDYTDDEGLISLYKKPNHNSVDNILLFTAEWCLIDKTVSPLEAAIMTKAIKARFRKGVLHRFADKHSPTSYDDHIGLFYFANYFDRQFARMVYDNAEKKGWVNGDKNISRFVNMRAFGKYCAGYKLSILDQMAVAGMFWGDKLFGGTAKETNGRCMMMLIKEVMYKKGFTLIDTAINNWVKGMMKIYPKGPVGVYAVYFGKAHPMTLNCKKGF